MMSSQEDEYALPLDLSIRGSHLQGMETCKCRLVCLLGIQLDSGFILTISTPFVDRDGLRLNYPVYVCHPGWRGSLQALDLRTHLNKKNRTIYGDSRLTYSGTTLTYSEATPTYSETTPTYSDTAPTYSETTPTYSETTLTYSETTLTYSDTASNYNMDCQLEDPREFLFYDYNFIESKGMWSGVLGTI